MHAIFDIKVLARFAIPNEFVGPMKFPDGFSLEKRNFKVAIPLSEETLNDENLSEHIAELFDIENLKCKVATSKLGNENDCYKFSVICSSITLGTSNAQIVSESELLDFLNGENNLNHLIQIV